MKPREVSMNWLPIALSLWFAAIAAGEPTGQIRLIEDTGPTVVHRYATGAAELEREFGGPRTATASLLASLSLGVPQKFGALTIIPLTGSVKDEPDGRSFDQAALSAADTSMGTQSLSNPAGEPQLALLGQVLEGEKTQDRFLERSMVIPPERQQTATAYCCEQKFVARLGEKLQSVPHLVAAPVRMQVLEHLVDSASDVHAAREWVHPTGQDQTESWAEIAARIHILGIPSQYLAYLDVVRHTASGVRGQLDQVALPPDTVGVAVASGANLLAVECFGGPRLASRAALAGVIASYQDVSGKAQQPGDVSQVAGELLKNPPGSDTFLVDSGGGLTVLYRTPEFFGTSLVQRNRPVHVLLVSRSAAGLLKTQDPSPEPPAPGPTN
jgi:hypothetical protein